MSWIKAIGFFLRNQVLLGGLASSVVDEQGFIWDLGGHVLFSHYDYFDNLLSDLLKENWLEHQREAWIWMRNQWIPYPFQNNMWRLPEKDLEKCLTGLDRLKANEASTADMDFDEWIVASFGAVSYTHLTLPTMS